MKQTIKENIFGIIFYTVFAMMLLFAIIIILCFGDSSWAERIIMAIILLFFKSWCWLMVYLCLNEILAEFHFE